MAQTNLNFDEKEEQIINEYKYKWNLSKTDTIQKIVREFKKLDKKKKCQK